MYNIPWTLSKAWISKSSAGIINVSEDSFRTVNMGPWSKFSFPVVIKNRTTFSLPVKLDLFEEQKHIRQTLALSVCTIGHDDDDLLNPRCSEEENSDNVCTVNKSQNHHENRTIMSSFRHESDVDKMDDLTLLHIEGRPTIPHVQSLRAPPASVAVQTKSERLIGLSHKEVTRRYLNKLHQDREKNKQVLEDCVENLPLKIRQLVYPEKPAPQTGDPWRMSHERRRRNGKIGEYWKDNIEKWMHNLNKQRDDVSPLGIKSKPIQPSQDDEKDGRLSRPERHGSQYSERGSGADSTFSVAGYMSEPNFIYHPGFHGSMQYNKKKLPSVGSVGSESRLTVPSNGYGSLHDELEFQRRYKKVFDLNKHIHFVHSNFINGQKIIKRTKLPPLRHVDGQQQPDASEGMDIFAVMSVQKYNHNKTGSNTGPVASPMAPPSTRRNTEAFFGTGVLTIHGDETPQQVETPRDLKPTLSPVMETNRERDSLPSVSSRSARKVYPISKTTFEFQTNLDQNLGIYSYTQDGFGMDDKENMHPVIMEENEYNTEQMDYPTNGNMLQPLAVNGVNVIETESDVDMDRTVVDQDKILKETTDIMEDNKPFNISVHVEYKKKKSKPSHFITQLQPRRNNETLEGTKEKKDTNEYCQIIPEEGEGHVENSREATEATMVNVDGLSQRENDSSLDRGDAEDDEHNHIENQKENRDIVLPKIAEPLTPREKPVSSTGHSVQEMKLPSISLRPFATMNGVEDK